MKKINFSDNCLIHDESGNEVYRKEDDFWAEYEYDENYNLIWYRDSTGFWSIKKYDKDNNKIYHADSDGFLFVSI